MRLLHYSKTPLDVVWAEAPRGRWGRDDAAEKPVGLWLSVEGEDDWANWCADNDFRIGPLVYEISADLSKLLMIKTGEELAAFSDHYGVRSEFCAAGDNFIDRIRWPEVGAKWSGIIIAPHQWQPLLSRHEWYCGWDCASGCVWDASAIKGVRFVGNSHDVLAEKERGNG